MVRRSTMAVLVANLSRAFAASSSRNVCFLCASHRPGVVRQRSRSSFLENHTASRRSYLSTSSRTALYISKKATETAVTTGEHENSDVPSRPVAVRKAAASLSPNVSSTESPFKVNLLNMSKTDLEELVISWGYPKFRAQQILQGVIDNGKTFSELQNLPVALRTQLDESLMVGSMRVAVEQVSKDGTRKRAYTLADGQVIESVLMPYSDGRKTACISSQAGCAMGCVFCATGQQGYSRQLTADEIYEQAFLFSSMLRAKGERLSNVVLMGMGEPLANYSNVMAAVRRINSELGIGARHITISTVGLVPRIQRLAEEDLQVKLAISLHAANDAARSALLPVNRRYPLKALMDACKEYIDATGRRITFEWALIQGENDSPKTAEELGKLLAPLKGMCHVNIIPLNPTKGYKGGPAVAVAVAGFCQVLERYGIPATPRVRRGIDIDAGCGQLTTAVVNSQKEAPGGESNTDPSSVFGRGL